MIYMHINYSFTLKGYCRRYRNAGLVLYIYINTIPGITCDSQRLAES